MNLAEFIDATLTEVIAGIRSAQAKPEGGNVVAGTNTGYPTSSALIATSLGVFAVIDFDVSVAAETTAGGKAAVKVFSALDIGAGGDHRHAQNSRVRFSVPVRLPEGDQTRKLKREEENRANFERDLSGGRSGWSA